MSRRTVPGLLAAAGSLALVAVVVMAPATSGSRLGRVDLRGSTFDAQEVVEPTLVRVEAEGLQAGSPWTATGWGVIVDPSGLILTNAHVAQPDAPGLAASYWNPYITATATIITVGVTPTPGGTAQEYTATTVAADGHLDAAIVRLDASSPTGTPVDPATLALPTLAFGDASVVTVGTPVSFATIAESGLNEVMGATTGGYYEQAGTVTELGNIEHVTTGPGRFLTDLASPTDFSGGALLDAGGAFIGLPTWHPGSTPEAVGAIRADLLVPLLDAAKAGTEYVSPYTVLGTGQESLLFSRWAPDLASSCTTPEPAPITSYPAGTSSIAAVFGYDAFTDGEDVFVLWYDPVLRQLIGALRFDWDGGPTGDCYGFGINRNDGQPMAEGTYAMNVFAGPTLALEATAETTVGEASAGTITVSGRIVNADTGQPIAGATVYVLDQGVDPQSWFNAPSDDQVASQGSTADDGTYSTAPPLVPGIYPFVVTAPGYFAVGGTLNLTEGGFLDDIALVAAE